MLLIIIVVIAIHTLSAGFLLAVSPIVFQIPSPENLWTKPGEHSVYTHTYTRKKKTTPFMHTDYIYLFIYHVCMHLMKCVCTFVYRLYFKKRWHLWTYLKHLLKKKKPYLSKNQVGTNSHSRNIYKIFIFRGECFIKSPIQSLTLAISLHLMDLFSLDL